MLDHLTNNKIQIGSVSGLDLLTTPNDLNGQLQAFLLSCKVNELSPSTLTNYQYQLGRFIAFCNPSDAQHITAQHIRLFLLKLQETNNPVSVIDYYKTIRRFFNWLVEEGILDESPMRNIKLPRMPKSKRMPFSQRDIDNLLLLCSGTRFVEVRNRAMVLLFLDTGLRLGELASIQLGDIDFGRETIKVMGKGSQERVVRMGKATQKALLRYLLIRKDSYLYLWVSEERKPMTREGIRVTIRTLCLRAEITDAKPGPHTFRHTFATMAIRNGANLFYVQSLLGHKTLAMTRVYANAIDSEAAVQAHPQFSPVDRLKIK